VIPTTSSDIFFTTDGNGVATIDFDLNANHYRILNAPHDILELDFGADLLELIFVAPPANRSATIEGISALSGGPSTVPEPASLALLAGGLAAGLALRRRARRA
jgi:hypothetical protein